jgi:hypothetical protein
MGVTPLLGFLNIGHGNSQLISVLFGVWRYDHPTWRNNPRLQLLIMAGAGDLVIESSKPEFWRQFQPKPGAGDLAIQSSKLEFWRGFQSFPLAFTRWKSWHPSRPNVLGTCALHLAGLRSQGAQVAQGSQLCSHVPITKCSPPLIYTKSRFLERGLLWLGEGLAPIRKSLRWLQEQRIDPKRFTVRIGYQLRYRNVWGSVASNK